MHDIFSILALIIQEWHSFCKWRIYRRHLTLEKLEKSGILLNWIMESLINEIKEQTSVFLSMLPLLTA